MLASTVPGWALLPHSEAHHGLCPTSRQGSGRPGSSHPSASLTALPHLDPSPRRRLTRGWPLLGAQYVTEAEEKLQRARLLVESVRKEKVDLSNQLEEERRYAPHPRPGPGGHLSSAGVPLICKVG